MGATEWPIQRYRDGRFEALDDPVVQESPLTLFVTDRGWLPC